MPEVMYVLKSLAIAVVLMIGMQMKWGSTSIENHMHRWIQTSPVSNYLQDVSAGAVRAIHNGSRAASGFFSQTFGHDSSVQKAGRLNFEFKRSQRYQEEQAEKDQ